MLLRENAPGRCALATEVFLHVGTHKTGTTALQNFLTVNRRTLLDNGILVPVSGQIDNAGGHHNIAWELNGDARYKKKHGTLSDLCSEISRSTCHTVVVSSEDFEYLYDSPDVLHDLNRRLSEVGCTVKVLIMLRPLRQYVPSLYAELKKHGLKCPFATFCKQLLNQEAFVMHDVWRFTVRYKLMAKGFIQVFGRANVQYCNYAKPVEDKFMKIIGHEYLMSILQPVPLANVRRKRR